LKYILILITITTFSLADLIRIWAGGNMPINSSQTNTNIWAMGKHFVPIVPNIRIEQTSLNAQGSKITNTELIAYYNLIDNTAWITLDVGAGISIKDLRLNQINKYLSFLRARVQIPLSSIGFEAIVKNNLLSINKFDTLMLKADINIVNIPTLLDLGIEVGFRTQNIQLDTSNLDIQSKDYFAGIVAKF